MGQQEIYNFLKDNQNKWFTIKEIAEALDISSGSVTSCIKKLRKTNFITFKENPERRQSFLYQYNS